MFFHVFIEPLEHLCYELQKMTHGALDKEQKWQKNTTWNTVTTLLATCLIQQISSLIK
jgi:hypothetical protein